MGYPFTELVPAAILYLEPGLTREQYARRLERIPEQEFCEFKSEDPLNIKRSFSFDRFTPLERLARVLLLGQSEQFEKFSEEKIDSHGIPLSAPMMLPREDGGYDVWISKENIIKVEEENDAEYTYYKLHKGMVFDREMGGGLARVVDILEEERLPKGKDEFEDIDFGPSYRYKLRLQPIDTAGEMKHYSSREEMEKEFPQFSADFMYDWRRERGTFPKILGSGFYWVKRGNRYYLDPKNMDMMPASWRGGTRLLEWGYTDLILTAEAIKKGAWKLLSRRGNIWAEQFLEAYPDSRRRMERAVWDAQTSISAKKKRMSVNELMRFRLEARL